MKYLAGLAALCFLGSQHTAFAADFDDTAPTPVTYNAPSERINWNGVYIGGFAGYSWRSVDTTHVTHVYNDGADYENVDFGVNYRRKASLAYGGMLGYNYQFDGAVAGIEGDYTYTGKNVILPWTYGSDTGTVRAAIRHLGTIRGRLGYLVTDQIMPYVTAGVAVGQVEYSSALSGDPENYTSKVAKANVGYALGTGLEYAITSQVLVRGEYQFVSLAGVDDYQTRAHTLRGGLAFKF